MKRSFMVLKGHVKSYVTSWGLKKATFTTSLSDVLIRRMTLRTHNIPSGRLKNDFGEVDKVDKIQGIEKPWEIIFCIPGIEKSDLDEVA
jgi:hypothetical protein